MVPDDAENIRLIEIEAAGRTIGELRNFGVAQSHGELVAHWDDDDFSAPGRLADQVGRLLESGKAVTGYWTMLFTDGKQWWKFHGNQHRAIGTSLLYRREWAMKHPFPAKQIGEDNSFGEEAIRARELVAEDAGELMVATIHSQNTSKRTMNHHQFRPVEGVPGIAGMEFPGHG